MDPQSGLDSMKATAIALVATGKGILAADESLPTIGKRFAPLGIESNPENRRAYRELLFETRGLGEFISGAILFDETIHQTDAAGVSLSEALTRQGIIVGIKVDQGTVAFPGFEGEKLSEGLDGLRERLATYRGLGARFAKWRTVTQIDDCLPSSISIAQNARTLALYAALCQEAGLVPIVEPEVLMDGKHSLARCEEVTSAVINAVIAALLEHRVALEATLLKTGMVLPGEGCSDKPGVEAVAQATIRCLERVVPPALPGVVFLSGGQSEVDATTRLNAIAKLGGGAAWRLTFSYGRALQDSALQTWRGSAENVAAAQKVFLHRARSNSLAMQGVYTHE